MTAPEWKENLKHLKISLEHLNFAQEQSLILGQITHQEKGHFFVHTDWNRVVKAKPRGRLTYKAHAVDLPCVGDWVYLTQLNEGIEFIELIIPRTSTLLRKAAGEGMQAQLMAANISHVLVVSSFNMELNLNRIDRYVTLAYESQATPVIVMTKSDLLGDESAIEDILAELMARFPQVEILVTGRNHLEALYRFRDRLTIGDLLVLLGSSGVGKSTLTNFIVGRDAQKTQEIREGDSKGRHTTTARHLLYTDEGFGVIDTPGMRELSLHESEVGMSYNFQDIEELALKCKFSNCTHVNEPHCAVIAGLRSGEIPQEKFDSYSKLKGESNLLTEKKNSVRAKDQKKKSRLDKDNQINRLKSKNKY